MNKYDLESRTKKFAIQIRLFFKNTKVIQFTEGDIKQLLRSSGSIGANYIEANDALSKKDFIYGIRICKKETKESLYWLNILSEFYNGLDVMIGEVTELQKIFELYMKNQNKVCNLVFV